MGNGLLVCLLEMSGMTDKVDIGTSRVSGMSVSLVTSEAVFVGPGRLGGLTTEGIAVAVGLFKCSCRFSLRVC